MAKIYPFQPYRYSEKAGSLSDLVTQPYDKITPALQAAYLAKSPYNLVRVILGPRQPDDSPANNVYTRAASFLNEWIHSGVLARENEAAIFPYFQEFTEPDSGERIVRQGFIALGAVEDYSARVVHRHEQTLSGPKKDRLELLRHTHAHFGQLFMLYPDPEAAIDAILLEASRSAPLSEVTDEYGVIHRIWKITDAPRIQELMADKKLVIADGHHRYETALAFRDENPTLPGADRVMMTFINMHSPGLRILATHRLVNGIPADGFPDDFLRKAALDFQVEEIDGLDRLKSEWEACGNRTIIGAAIGNRLFKLEARDMSDELDVRILHEVILAKVLDIGEEAVRDEKHLRYMRGLDHAVEEARNHTAQIAFLLKPTSVGQVADTSFAGGVMPQKSTDFYPKVLTGLTIYKLD
ncbi:MAG TPA: DUF1015 domain-containing protein [Candidatus Sulfopaludibacter sp.]|nr:DUF1015 domain-containing protein [Candidatus Sulfopaludibacter sp.]